MTDTTPRLERRIRRDFPEPGSATGVLRLLAGLPERAGYDRGMLTSERVQAAIVLAAGGDLARLRQMLDLAATDWRDLLIYAELAHENWPQLLDAELGEEVPERAGRPWRVLEFSPAYSCQADRGTPMTVRFTPAGGRTWTGSFEAGPGGADGVFACPDPLQALVICEGRGYLTDVSGPGSITVIGLSPVTHATSAGPGLIVLAGYSSLVAFGPRGQAWASERLCLDNLKIVGSSADSIDCIGDFPDAADSFTVDARTGTVSAGRRFRPLPGR